MSAVTGSSFGARGTLSSFRPASCGRRLPLRVFTSLLDHTRFSHVSAPPRERGRTWSRLPSSSFSNLPVYWQRLPSRSRIVFARSFGRFFGTLAKFTATITVGTRIGPRTVCTALSCGRTGSVIHSSHVTGRSASARAPSPNSISSAVATLVAIMQNASCGVRTWMACQLRFSTSTILLFSISIIEFLRSDGVLESWRTARSSIIPRLHRSNYPFLLGVCSLLFSRPRNTRNDAKLNSALVCIAFLAGDEGAASPGFAPAYARSYGGQARCSGVREPPTRYAHRRPKRT